ncbi:lytic transglycosylase domain-containing protein [Thermodesulfobacteriota bacterium]
MTRLPCILRMIFFALFAGPIIGLLTPAGSLADIAGMKRAIVDYNTRIHKASLLEDTYRGEEGILMMKPDVARSFNLSVPEYPDYEKGKALFKKAEKVLDKTIKIMEIQVNNRGFRKKHISQIADLAVFYNKTIKLAREKLSEYRSKLDPKLDERLDPKICTALLEILLEESLREKSRNLRDSLGHFYNLCHGIDKKKYPLTAENVLFVNFVFNEEKSRIRETSGNKYDMDTQNIVNKDMLKPGWRSDLSGDESRFLRVIESELQKREKTNSQVDALLFLALIKQESRFDPKDVSRVGAAGLTQIMPGTGKKLGMTHIFSPPYYEEAGTLLAKERSSRGKAIRIIYEIKEENKLELAKKAMVLMGQSLDYKKRRKILFTRYARELRDSGKDERLDPFKSIKYGLEYFSSLMTLQNGDISLALASYNAGPHRVKKYKGLPPFSETVGFRNRVLVYYKEYLEKLEKYKLKKSKGR